MDKRKNEGVYVDIRPNGTYRVRLIFWFDGKKIRTSRTYYPQSKLTAKENLKAANDFGAFWLQEIKKELQDEKDGKNPTVRDFFENVYLERAKLKLADTTYELNVNTNVKLFLPTFGDLKLNEVTKAKLQDKIQELVNKLNENLEDPKPIQSQTVERYVSTFRAVISMAVKEGVLESDPFAGGMTFPKAYTPIIKRLSEKDYAILIEYLRGCVESGNVDRVAVIIALGLLAGLRRGEIVSLQWGDILNLTKESLEYCQICVNSAAIKVKGEKQKRSNPKSEASKRAFAIQSDLAKVLLEWKKIKAGRGLSVSSNDYVITGRTKEMVSVDTPARWVSDFIDELNEGRDLEQQIEKVGLHSLRHTFASVLVRSEMDIETIREIMGHDDIRTTQIYLYSFKIREKDLMTDVNEYNNKLIEKVRGEK